MSTTQSSWAGVGCRSLAAIFGMARFIAATRDWATRTPAHIAAVTERRPARRGEGPPGGGGADVVMPRTLGCRSVDLKCKVCTP
ncbi:hypothetical protein GCM10009864_38230 [Streptomyces lunalinharesii]|uniref:Uncharacterized protein n=1 Tax=Streptomyces lunalinharesii TaxID=333384 RepID=A0ABN3S1G2_9ACTN